MTGEAFPRLVIIMLCINVTLILGGAPIFDDGGDSQTGTNAQINYTVTNVNASASSSGSGVMNTIYNLASSIPFVGPFVPMLSWITTMLVFLVTGGIVVILASAGLPLEIQWLVGAPVTAVAILSGIVYLRNLLRK